MINIDPIVKNVRSAREKLFAINDGNLDKLLDYYQGLEELDSDRLVKSKKEKQNKKPDTGAA